MSRPVVRIFSTLFPRVGAKAEETLVELLQPFHGTLALGDVPDDMYRSYDVAVRIQDGVDGYGCPDLLVVHIHLNLFVFMSLEHPGKGTIQYGALRPVHHLITVFPDDLLYR